MYSLQIHLRTTNTLSKLTSTATGLSLQTLHVYPVSIRENTIYGAGEHTTSGYFRVDPARAPQNAVITLCARMIILRIDLFATKQTIRFQQTILKFVPGLGLYCVQEGVGKSQVPLSATSELSLGLGGNKQGKNLR